ncbi:ATP-binding cassette domain-containing protein [Trichococcus ilyis]|uniref:ABC-2 type transport system ATP-binding protein n=1 Tax=Trichococcus ilyis TaxID=640938 RepID=A0A143YN93_9LACT|nr:ABC transporter ATP-binding protein [Trichococcus ilyis]CZQ93749.1 abc transporter [Trichococcus ilyis]SEI98805.1 ABC-2 type transport system ATP-binding protein [Trichococcus ilyis]
MIVMENAVVTYPDFKLDCSLEVQEGTITGIVGENGAGKTTLFKALLGLVPIAAGSAKINGQDIAALSLTDREDIGTVLAESFFNDIYTIRDLNRLLKSFYRKFDESYFLAQCAAFGLPDKQPLKQFSTGMKAKLKTLTALSHGAQLLILDEPTSGLDVSARYEILDLLQDYLGDHPRCSILISSHISSDLEKLCDDIYYLKAGKILLHEETDRLLDAYGVLKVDDEALGRLDREHLLYRKRTNYGYDLLTDQRLFYMENFPKVIVEKPTIDQILLLIMEGERL